MATKRTFEITFTVDIEEAADLPEGDKALAVVEDLVADVWDDAVVRARRYGIVDSVNFCAVEVE